ncbi:Dsim\GD16514-PA-like protein [Anopheles sinensis]|uniref:Dsim\GD16514-PA-like protein n=1 Tax=Anopheles sinensis TaxID=74873 RepID=A0A084W4F1_ANOSI|nr:Dsim\GD16514-PA-like protein [Anopheles sinensis]
MPCPCPVLETRSAGPTGPSSAVERRRVPTYLSIFGATVEQFPAKVATEKNEPAASAASVGGRSSRSSPSTVDVTSPTNVPNSTVPPPRSPSEPASSPPQTVLPEVPTIMAGHTVQTATGPTTTAATPTATPVLAWSPLLFPPWNTALLPAAFYPALRSLPG